jgi:transposase, IS5 family
MLSKKKLSHQLNLFNGLADQLNQKHPLFILSDKINWKLFDESFESLYCGDNGRPAKPIRLMVGLILLKHLRNLSDESIVEQWSENNYYQYFTGEITFNCEAPCTSSELVVFRNRIGEAGMELILKESIRVNDDETPLDTTNLIVSVDTTVQEKNITYPTDDKQYKKIIKKCWRIANENNIILRRSYTRTVKILSIEQRFKNTSKGYKAARKASRRIRTIAGALVRELGRKLSEDRLLIYSEMLDLFMRVIKQKRTDCNKIYSLHELQVKCYTKGKEHKKFEFGSKCSIAVDQQTGIIVAACNESTNKHDSKTIPAIIEQCKRLTNKTPKQAFVDRGYRGAKTYEGCLIEVPKQQANITKQKRKRHSRRAAIEPVIGHLKTDYRLGRNFYKGVVGDIINVLLAAAAMNFKRVMNLWRSEAIYRWKLIGNYIAFIYWNIYAHKLKMTF